MWSDRQTVRRLVALFAAFAAVCLCAGASRLAPPAWELAPVGGLLRVREALSMFVFAPALMVLFVLIARAVGRGALPPVMLVLAVLSVYFVACGMGLHDPADRLGGAFAGPSPAGLHETLDFLDNHLGHWVFWAGFVLGTWVLGIQQARAPLDAPVSWKGTTALLALAAILLYVMLTNLWDEYPSTIRDLFVIAAAVSVPTAAGILRRAAGLRRLPVLLVVLPAFWGSILGTVLCWLVRYLRFGHV